jgi:hypothetical protein
MNQTFLRFLRCQTFQMYLKNQLAQLIEQMMGQQMLSQPRETLYRL